MRKLLILAATAAAVTAVPAAAQDRAGEGRIEARGGVAWVPGDSEAFAGIGAGYDFDLGETAFAGAEIGADKVLQGGANVLFSVGGRFGAKVGERSKVYVLGGYGFTKGDDAAYAGAGFQLGLGQNLYGKVEYRRTLNSGTDVNFAGAGLGVSF